MRVLAVIGALAIVAALGAMVFLLGGYFDVATGWEDPPPVKAVVARIREASIARHATDAPPADLGSETRVKAGARAFATLGCVNCHGAPGVTWQKFSEGMNPDPPDLKEVVGELSPPKVFYVVKNGIRMTGMPGFSGAASDDELWSLVSYLKKLPDVSEADYKNWTMPAAGPAKQ